MRSAVIHARVEPELKRDAAAVLAASGLDMSTAIRLFLRSVVEKGSLPMNMQGVNATTRAAIQRAKTGKMTRTVLEDL
ncbi:MAG: type II toxin-antitoxin system RelB/DinJ family antitoxin [Proteobacteria bacterium]|nr:type II toxin-antitoxin system RelB/DinJ family antitoxin [Pseudomonadota bacterium]